jgi:uncharacterized protein YkwD
MPKNTASRWILSLLATAILLTGCGGGSDETEGLVADIAQGNAEQIRKDYAALDAKSSGSDVPPSASSSAPVAATSTATMAAVVQPALHPFAEAALAAVNLARSQARTCGDSHHPAVGPLAWDARAAYAALLESEWMLENNSFGHAWPGGELVWDRLTMSGYDWSKADENIAAGYRSLDKAMQAWIDSPPHCVALMRPDVTEVGIALVPGREGSTYLSYWTMVLASPR